MRIWLGHFVISSIPGAGTSSRPQHEQPPGFSCRNFARIHLFAKRRYAAEETMNGFKASGMSSVADLPA
jgi:hypothetical protein